jgi:hypothetical protein
MHEGGHPSSRHLPRDADTSIKDAPMNAQQFNDITIGTPVIVHSFGVHYGRIAGKRPAVTIQGRTFTADDWLKVAIAAPDGTTREWNGTYQDVEI